MTTEQIVSEALRLFNIKDETKAEEIAFHKARINGLKQKNGCMAREIASNEQRISNIHEKVMVLEQELEEELWWQRFINYCNRFC